MMFPARHHRRAREAMARRRPRKKAANHRLALNLVGSVFGAHQAERNNHDGRNKDQCAPVFFHPILLTLNTPQILLFIGRNCFRLVLLIEILFAFAFQFGVF